MPAKAKHSEIKKWMKLWNLKQMVKVKVLIFPCRNMKPRILVSSFLFHFINQVHRLQVLTEHLSNNLNPLHFIDKQDMPDEGDFLSYQTVNKCATSKQRKFLSLKDTELNCQLNATFWMQKPSLCNMEESFRSIYMCMSKNKY